MIKNKIQYIISLLSSEGNSSMADGKILPFASFLHTRAMVIVLISVIMLVACERHTPAWKQMDIAESLMNTKPDSSLAVLDGIPASDIKGKETSPRYALLKSMALDKNYIDTTTFDVLQPAIDYYVKHGSPDEQLRTYYYQGRIYQNQGNNDLAMQSFMWGKEFCQEASDTLTIANLMVAQATIQYRIYKIDDFIENNLEAANLYSAIGRTDYELLSLVNALDGGILNNDSFQRIVHNLDDLFSIYPEISIGFRVNVDKSNQSEYSRIYSFLKERYGKYNINIHPGYVTDDFSAEPNNCCFEADEVNKFVLEQYDNHNIPISLYPHPLFGECSARHITSFVIGPEGELYKCWNDIGIKEKTIGTVKEVSLSNELLLKYLLENDPLSDTNCENCSCFPICEGGCPYKRIYQKDGQENFCKAKRKGIIDKLKRHIDFKYKNNKIIQ